MSYSDYARQGYFQLVFVVGLAGLLLLGAHEVMGRSRRFVGAGVALLVLTGVILASAAFRLRLYQEAYGWTELRFFVAASIAWLGLALVIATALVLANRMRWIAHGLAMTAVAVTLVVTGIGPQAFVMEQNIARVLDPRLVQPEGHSGLDLTYGLTLGDDAVPHLVAALDALPPAERARALEELRFRRDLGALNPTATSPFAWNLARERAREALARLPSD
jgi:two-component system, OmpR family, sensor histidine kinase BaeS